jgi:hypothetical protein
LYAWPGQAVLSRLRPGNRVPLALVGTATSSRTGQYKVAVSDMAAVRTRADRHGMVNLEVAAFAGHSGGTYSFTRRLVATGRGTTLAAAGAGPTAQQANLAITRSSPAAPPCGTTTLIKNYGPQRTWVGVGYETISPNVDISFQLGSGQGSTLGAAEQQANGTWIDSGVTVGSVTTSEAFPDETASTLFGAKFSYGEFAVACGPNIARALGFDAGEVTSATSSPTVSAANCINVAKGNGFTKSGTEAFTFANGVNMSAEIGIDLSSQTGYSPNASISFQFAGRAGQLCGTAAPPTGTPKRLLAQG